MARHSKFRACPLCEAICGLELQYEDDRPGRHPRR